MSSQLTDTQISDIQGLVNGATKIVVTAHKNPDGDAIGSALGMYHFLKSFKQEVVVVLPDHAPDFLHWMKDYDKIIFFDQENEKATEKILSADLIFSLDYNHLARVGSDMQAALEKATAPFILIDHHQQPAAYPKVTYSDTSSCSTCEMVFRFVEQCGWKKHINVAMAECIYCGIMTDSGSFRFHTVTPDTHRIVGELMTAGIDHAQIHRDVYDVNLMDKLRLVGYALSEKLEVLEDCSTAVIYLEQEELQRYNYRQGDTEGLVNQALSVRGIKLAAFFREGNNEIKASFRSKGSFDVNKFSRENWGGGGHMNAAGGVSLESMQTTVAKFKSLVVAMKEQINNS